MTESIKAAVVLTKDEKIAKLKLAIAAMELKLYNVENDIVTVRPVKVIALPEVGTDVIFKHGRTTATTEPVERIGRVVAVKPSVPKEDGKSTPAQIKLAVGEGFDQEFVVVYLGQIVSNSTAAE